MPGIMIRDGDSFESALKKFKKQCEKAGILSEVRKREAYEKPSVKRKKKDAAAVSKAHVNFMRNIFKREPIKIEGHAKLKGMYKRSIVVDFFVRKKHVFTSLDPKDFY